jgi:hypothetical protein
MLGPGWWWDLPPGLHKLELLGLLQLLPWALEWDYQLVETNLQVVNSC